MRGMHEPSRWYRTELGFISLQVPFHVTDGPTVQENHTLYCEMDIWTYPPILET